MPLRTTPQFQPPPRDSGFGISPWLKELDRVVLGEAVDTGAGRLPRGAEGTVVLVWRNGEAFEVEFERPFPAVVMLQPHQLGPVPSRGESL